MSCLQNALLKRFKSVHGKFFIAICSKNVKVVPNGGINVDSLQPCNQEEADTRIFYMQFMHLLIVARDQLKAMTVIL